MNHGAFPHRRPKCFTLLHQHSSHQIPWLRNALEPAPGWDQPLAERLAGRCFRHGLRFQWNAHVCADSSKKLRKNYVRPRRSPPRSNKTTTLHCSHSPPPPPDFIHGFHCCARILFTSYLHNFHFITRIRKSSWTLFQNRRCRSLFRRAARGRTITRLDGVVRAPGIYQLCEEIVRLVPHFFTHTGRTGQTLHLCHDPCGPGFGGFTLGLGGW